MAIVGPQPDYDGWYNWQFHLVGGYLLLECHPKRSVVLLSFAGSGKCQWSDPEAVQLAIAVLRYGQTLHPLLDWMMENEHLSGRWDWSSWLHDDDWHRQRVREAVTDAIAALAATEKEIAGEHTS